MASFHHVALNCRDMKVTEKWYTEHFGFTRARYIQIPDANMEIVFLKLGDAYLELFAAEGDAPKGEGDGPHTPGVRHIALKVDDVDATIAKMGPAADVSFGPMGFDAFIPGWKTAWLRDPDGTIVEISQGYQDEDNPPPLEG